MESNITQSRLHLDVKVRQPEQPYSMCFLPRPPSSPNSPPKRLLLEFVLQNFHLDNPQLPFPRTHEFIDRDTLTSPTDKARDIIVTNLSELLRDISLADYEPIVGAVVAFSKLACEDPSNLGRETIPIRVRVRVTREQIFDEREWLQLVANAIADGDTRSGMVPSTKKSIKDLQIKKLTSEDFKTDHHAANCAVCLENFVLGTDVTCMPCAHMFHKDCITNWLEESHYCPLCRFEMPTEVEEEEDVEGEGEYHEDVDEYNNSSLETPSEDEDEHYEDEDEFEDGDEDDEYRFRDCLFLMLAEEQEDGCDDEDG